MDVIVRVAALPAAGETVLGEDAVLRPGGKGANQAVAAALGGADVTFAGSVGDDAHAASIRTALVAAGVNDELLQTTHDRSTGIALVLVTPDGENAIAVSPGANHAFQPGDVPRLRERLAAGDVLLLQMELRPDVVARGVDLAADSGAVVVLNLAPAAALARSVLDRVAVLVVNRSEAEFLIGHELIDDSALQAAAAELRELGPASVVLTAGAGGAVVSDVDGQQYVPALEVDAVDTAGAGDAFVGVLAAELSRGRSLRTAVTAATAAAAVAVQTHGAQLTSSSFRRKDDQASGD